MATEGFSLTKFMSNVKDFARGYTFFITLPNIINGGSVKDVRYLVKSSSLPVGTINPIETDWQGNKYKLAGTQEFTDFTVTFNVDVDDDIRKSFVEWQNVIHNPQTNIHGKPGREGYMEDIQIEHISHTTGDPIMTYNLIGAWPTTVGELALDYSTQDVATFDVTFVYQLHELK